MSKLNENQEKIVANITEGQYPSYVKFSKILKRNSNLGLTIQ